MQKGGINPIIFLMVILVLILSVFLTGGIMQQKSSVQPDATPTPQVVAVAPNPTDAAGSSLQIGTLPFVTLTPPPPPTPTAAPTTTSAPTKTCGVEGVKTDTCSCPDMHGAPGIPEDVCSESGGCALLDICNACTTPVNFGGGCAGTYMGKTFAFNCTLIKQIVSDGQVHCVGKPVIYLYPTHTTAVNVTLQIPGSITESIPAYPENGWQGVSAGPNGTLLYNNRQYHELYYETTVGAIRQPTAGIVIPKSQLRETLTTFTARLGLSASEQQEFLSYWMPKLIALHSPYVYFSILDQSEKERIDHVTISPRPDTWIAFLAYFKPLQTSFLPGTSDMLLPKTPTRHGFTAVEWGGTIDY